MQVVDCRAVECAGLGVTAIVIHYTNHGGGGGDGFEVVDAEGRSGGGGFDDRDSTHRRAARCVPERKGRCLQILRILQILRTFFQGVLEKSIRMPQDLHNSQETQKRNFWNH